MTSIRTKLIFVLSLILLSGFFFTNFFSYTTSKKSVRTSIIENSLPLSRDNIYSEIQKDLTRPIFVSSLMANDTFLKDWVLGGEAEPILIRKYLEEIKDQYGFFTSFFVSHLSKKYYHFKGIQKEINPKDPHDSWYYDFKDKDIDYELNVDTNQAAKNHLTVFINHRLLDYTDRFLGAVGVGLDFDRVATLLEHYKNKYNRNVYMVDANGVIQVHTDKTLVKTISIHDIPGLKDLAPKILDKFEPPSFFEYDAQDRHILLTSRYIQELEWFLMVEQDETLALQSIKNTFFKNLLISFGITFITLIFATLVINYFQKKLETMAMTDPLTRAYNRNEFEHRFQYMTDMNRRKPTPMSMVLFDIDYLKTINDTHGHLAGDRVIKSTARIANQTIRNRDMLIRWGGDEFILLIFSKMEHARQVAERLRTAIDAHPFLSDFPGKVNKVTVSCGLAAYKSGEDLDEFLQRADRALYQAKAEGKNRIVEEN